MKELEETNCEIRKVIKFKLPKWNQLESWEEEAVGTTEEGKDSSLSQTSGGFLNSECRYAWLSHHTKLVVVDVKQGYSICSWKFPNRISSVSAFPAQEGYTPLLLVGTDNNAIRIKDSIGQLFIFDCRTSMILNIIQLPAGVEKACVIHGGAVWEEYMERRPDTVLSGNTGLIFVALRNLQHIVIDVNRSLWEKSFLDGEPVTTKLEFVNTETLAPMSKNDDEPVHLAYNLMDRDIEHYMGFNRQDFEATPLYDENLCSVLLSSERTGCLITGCLGRTIIWQSDGSIGWISPPFDENAYVTHVALLEPSDDPRPFYYLWVACQNDSPDSSAVLRMYAMLFNRKHSDRSGESSLYFNLESEPNLKFELELEQGERVHSLTSVQRENHRDDSEGGEESLLLIGTEDRLLVFDLNRWYKEQMPRTMAECRNPNSVMASYRTKQEGDQDEKRIVLCSGFVPRSLREFLTKGPSSPEELFFPNSLSLEWLELGLDHATRWIARGVQSELLREITIAGPIVLIKPTEIYRRCLAAGLVPFDASPQDYSFVADPSNQRQMLLSLCLEQRWSGFLLRCAIEWSDGSASLLYPEFLRWGVERASDIKLIADQLCVPLFDQSGSNIGETEVRTLRFCEQQLNCLGSVVARLPNATEDLERQRRALKRMSAYLQVLLWFHDVGLLPETQEVDVNLPEITLAMKIPYPKDELVELYKKKREYNNARNGRRDETLFIDQLMYYECPAIKSQWQREGSDIDGYYPPPSLQSLLRSFLTDCHRDVQKKSANDVEDEVELPETETKHCVTIYLLMDLAMLLQSTHSSIEQLIKYPSAFNLTPSTIKLTQAFWLLDHEDYEGFFRIVTGELISMSDIKDWHHKLAVNTLLRNDQHKLALSYLRILKPPISSLEEQGIVIGLSVAHGLVEEAFHARPSSHYAQLLTKFYQACKAHGKLKDILHLSLDSEEEEAFVKFLKEGGCEETRLLYYLQRSRHTEAIDLFSMETNSNSRRSVAPKSNIKAIAIKMLNAYNNTFPDITKRFATTISKTKNMPLPAVDRLEPYQLYQQRSLMERSNSTRTYPQPMSKCRDKKRDITEIAVEKTRETCLRAGRVHPSVNFVPFVGAPCSTIVFCTKLYGSSALEETDANCVLYPEKKVTANKRTRNMMSSGNGENVDDDVEKKRRRLGSISDTSITNTDKHKQFSQRLSMSQICNTPLVQRKNMNCVAIETPHSILKIRELIRRNSGSPSFSFANGSAGRDALLKHSGIDVRSARQIRFSVDRLSGNEDSSMSMNETNQEQEEVVSNISGSSKNTEIDTGTDEAYYSPSTSMKSLRDSSFLSDTSTKIIRGPRPRPSLRRTSLTSRTSSDNLSNMTDSLSETTLNISVLEASSEKIKKLSNASSLSSRKSLLGTTVYSASILDADSSIESSPFKKPLIVVSHESTVDEESEESDEQSEEEGEIVSEVNDTGINKDSSVDPISVRDEEITEEDVTKKVEEQAEEQKITSQESKDDDIQTEDTENEKEHDSFASTNVNPSQENEISEDEGVEEEITLQEQLSNDQEMEEDECDSFQSLCNSYNDTQANPEKTKNTELEILKHFTGYNQDFSLTQNLARTCKEDEESQADYSLTKPIFLDNRGILTLHDVHVDITDDESIGELEEVDQPNLESTSQLHAVNREEDEEVELSLNLSGSEGSDKEMEKNSRTNGLNNLEESKNSPNSEVENRRFESPYNKELSLEPRSRLSSISSTKSDDTREKGTPIRRSSRNQSYSTLKPSPRRSIKSVSSSPNLKIESEQLGQKVEKERRGTSITKEIKKILVRVEGDQIAEESEDKDSIQSQETGLVSKVLISKSHTSSRQSSRESSQEKSTQKKEKETLEESRYKRATRTSQKESTDLLTTRTRATRANSVSKDTEKLVKKIKITSASEAIKEITEEPAAEETIEKKTGRPRITRAAVKDSTAIEESSKEEEIVEKRIGISRSTRAALSAKDITSGVEEKELEKETIEKKGKSRVKKGTSVLKDTTVIEQSKKEEVIEKKTGNGKSKLTRAASTVKESIATVNNIIEEPSKEQEESQEDEKASKPRATRASSQVKDVPLRTTRKTRTTSTTQEDEEISEEKSLIRKTRAGSVLKDNEIPEEKVTTSRKTRAISLIKDDTIAEEKVTTRKTRAGSVLKNDELPITPKRSRAGSMSKEEEIRKTRTSSQVKETSTVEELKRGTRASSVIKDTDDQDETVNKRLTRKRGGSVPKDIPTILEATRRNRRSTSLLKEVILEESLSQLDSPMDIKRTRRPIDETTSAISSPAANTRSRRSSIQSVPDEDDDVFTLPAVSKKVPTQEIKGDIRSRRATSVDAVVAVPVGKRVTRSVLAKTNIIEEVIPEEVGSKSPVTKKQTSRRKRATSVPAETGEEEAKDKAKSARAKRGRKASESKAFEFSPPEEAGELPEINEGCRTPTYEFSEPAGFQKFLTPVKDDDEESTDMTTKRFAEADEETAADRASRIRRPRAFFVMPKKTKDRAK